MAAAFVSWPSTYMSDLVVKSLHALPIEISVSSESPDGTDETTSLVQWSTYDDIVHSMTLESSQNTLKRRVLSSSYTIRKALIRKHFLHRTFTNYTTKHPDSVLVNAVPKTWSIDLAFADELDELWGDELWELGQSLDENTGGKGWWILKPGMADRGMGIRLFRDREGLMRIFESFDDPESEDDDAGSGNATGVATSQLRHFVIQEYLPDPLLVDPAEATLLDTPYASTHTSRSGRGRKFHLRAYCVASGALKLYLCPRILALFASTPYSSPKMTLGADGSESEEEGAIDLRPHLTNTSLQTDNADVDANVRLLDELVGSPIYSQHGSNVSGRDARRVLSRDDVDGIVDQVAAILAETFNAALTLPVHFQPLPNAFEVFGADLLITHSEGGSFQVNILELNAEPAIELTGARLNWILEEFFHGIAEVCVKPFLFPDEDNKTNDWKVGETRCGLRKCLDVQVHGR